MKSKERIENRVSISSTVRSSLCHMVGEGDDKMDRPNRNYFLSPRIAFFFSFSSAYVGVELKWLKEGGRMTFFTWKRKEQKIEKGIGGGSRLRSEYKPTRNETKFNSKH